MRQASMRRFGPDEVVPALSVLDDLSVGDLLTAGRATVTGLLTRGRMADSSPAVAVGDIAISAGWGNTAVPLVVAGSTERHMRIQVTAGGTGIGAGPTVTITFPGGAYAVAPRGHAVRNGGSGAGSIGVLWAAPTTTQWVITLNGTPVSGSSYIFEAILVA